jgi:hypothetical protein
MLCTETGEIDVVEVPGLVISHKRADHLVDDPIRSGLLAGTAAGPELGIDDAHTSITAFTDTVFRGGPKPNHHF